MARDTIVHRRAAHILFHSFHLIVLCSTHCTLHNSSPLSCSCNCCPVFYVSWALALFSQVRSPLIFYPWIAIALSLILWIFRFAHRSIALKETSGLLLEKSAKMLDNSKNYRGSHPVSITYVCMYSVKEMPPGAISFTQFKDTQLMKQRWQNRKDNNQVLLCVV